MDNNQVINPTAIDHTYSPFPPFATWSQLKVDVESWNIHQKELQISGAKDPALLAKARESAKRAAAIDTGAIEGLYELDAGFTITVATQVGMWRAAYEKKTEEVRKLIEAQLAGYDEVIDLATNGTPMAEAWLRGLHRVICAGQKTYQVHTEHGFQEQALPLGEYKSHPNHVILSDGSTHAYAPVLQTEPEMQRFIRELCSPDFSSAHPLIQAAYAHYVLVWIHPFADGNGRTARALASVFTYRSASIPYMVLLDHKPEYMTSLRKADKGDYQSFVDFAYRRAIDTFGLIKASLLAARYPSSEEITERARRLHYSRGGYTHQDVDSAGFALLRALRDKAVEYAEKYQIPNQIRYTIDYQSALFPDPPTKQHRPPRSREPHMLIVRIDSSAPAAAQAVENFCYYVPLDAGPEDHFIVYALQTGESIQILVGNSFPKPNTVALLQISMFFEGVFGALYARLTKTANENLKSRGYT